MPSQVDHVADVNGVELLRFSKLYEFPDFVKSADHSRNVKIDGLPVTAYADPTRQQFPCHTKASTWLSLLYFQEKAAEFHPNDRTKIQERLDHYSSTWGIKDAADKLRRRWHELHKTAEDQRPDSDYAYVMVHDNGTKERHLRLSSREEVKHAAEWLHKYRDHMPFSHRSKIAVRILSKAASYGVHLGDETEFLERQAGRGVCDPKEVADMIRGRALLAHAGPLRDQFNKMASAIETSSSKFLGPDMLVKLAETMDQLDRGLNLVGKYTDKIPRPEDVIFKATFRKTAAAVQAHCVTPTGKVYEKSALERISVDDVRSLFGDDFADRVRTGLKIDPEKLAEEVRILPRPDAELFDGLMSDNGVSPALSKVANVTLPRDVQDALANAYHVFG